MKFIWLATLLLIGSVDVVATSVLRTPCNPSCEADRGVCLEGRCFCRSPYGGARCETILLQGPHPESAEPTRETRARVDAENLQLFGVSELEPEAEADLEPQGDTRLELQLLPGSDPSVVQSAETSELLTLQKPHSREYWQGSPAASSSPLKADRSPQRPHHLQHSVGFLKKDQSVVRDRPQARALRESQTSEDVEDAGSVGPLGPSAAAFAMSEKHRAADSSSGTDPRMCIPWLAELRSIGLRNISVEHHLEVITDMKVTRYQSFHLWAGSGSKIQKHAFLARLTSWFNGPNAGDAAKLFDRLDQSPRDGSLTFDEYNWENLCGYRQLLMTVLSSQGEQLSQDFRFIDTNKDGKLEEKEFVARSTSAALGLFAAAAKAIFKQLDADTSGVLSRAEFQLLGGLPRLRQQVSQREPDETAAFHESDSDNDGYLSRKEFDQHVVDIGAFQQAASADTVLLALDTNNDGKVAEAEYVRTCFRRTGSTCKVGSVCPTWRGPALCEEVGQMGKGACVCAEGFCAKNGACIPEELHRTGDSSLGPEADSVANSMSQAQDRMTFKHFDGVALAKVALGILSFTAVMSQMKATFENYPQLMGLVFTFSVIAFVTVVYQAFESWVPGTIQTNIQACCVTLVCASCTLSLTSAVRLWRPRCAASIPVLWYCFDDAGDYGVSTREERIIGMYRKCFLGFGILCVFGVYHTPVSGLEDQTFKMMICTLYIFIVLIDCFMLEHEVERLAFRNLIWEIEMQATSGDQSVKVSADGVGAEWNHREDSNTVRFSVRRRSPSTSPDFVKVAASEAADSQDLYFVDPCDDKIHYLRGRVVLLWQDTAVQLVQRSSSGWIPACSPEAAEKGSPMTSEGEVLCPCVQVNDKDANQSVQQKMHVLTQAGAAGLIVGQRDYGAPDSQSFELQKDPVEAVWPGEYTVYDSNGKFGPENYQHNWFVKRSVILGSAINTFVLSNQDFQEIAWVLEACDRVSMTDPRRKQQTQAVVAHLPGSRPTSFQERDNKAGAMSKLDLNMKTDSILHLRLGQRQILKGMHKGSGKSAFAWLDNVRTWILQAPIVNWKIYPGLHLIGTFVALVGCLWIQEQLSCQLHDNQFPKLAMTSFAFMALFQGVNASYDMHWWPLSDAATKSNYQKRWGSGQTLGMVATTLVVITYTILALIAFIWNIVNFQIHA